MLKNIFSDIVLDINDAVILKATEEEEEAHLALLKLIDKKSKGNCLWTKPLTEDTETLN